MKLKFEIRSFGAKLLTQFLVIEKRLILVDNRSRQDWCAKHQSF